MTEEEIKKLAKKIPLDDLVKLYVEFCFHGAHTVNIVSSSSAPDFIGWLKGKLDD